MKKCRLKELFKKCLQTRPKIKKLLLRIKKVIREVEYKVKIEEIDEVGRVKRVAVMVIRRISKDRWEIKIVQER